MAVRRSRINKTWIVLSIPKKFAASTSLFGNDFQIRGSWSYDALNFSAIDLANYLLLQSTENLNWQC